MEEVLCSSKNCYMEPFCISNEGIYVSERSGKGPTFCDFVKKWV